MLVAPDVDGICASRILADLFRQDDIMYRIIPVAGITELERLRDDFMTDTEVCIHPVQTRLVMLIR